MPVQLRLVLRIVSSNQAESEMFILE